MDFIIKNLRGKHKRLLHRYKDGISQNQGYLIDYAFIVWALDELYEATFEIKYLKIALELHQIQLDHFWDKNSGGFYFTADDSEEILTRQKDIYDGAIPSGNSIALMNLLRLSYLTGNHKLEEKADIMSRVYADKIRKNPLAYTQFMIAIDFAIGPTYSLVIAGDSNSEDTNELIDTVLNEYIPNKVFIHRKTEQQPPDIDSFSNFVGFFDNRDNSATAYICIDKTCKPPAYTIEEIREYLNSKWIPSN